MSHPRPRPALRARQPSRRTEAACQIRLPQIQRSQPVNEATFTKLTEDLNESLSSSDSSGSEEEEADNVKNGDTTLAALLKRQAKISQTEGDDGFASSKRNNGAGNAPLL
jgi:hypothetical protein